MSKVAFVFPGQGSQSVGMLAEMAAAYPIVQQTFAEASDALGYDLWEVCQQGPDTELNQTHITQPALLAASVALYRVIEAETDLRPSLMAGHSLGEYSALVASGAMTLATGVKLVEQRGRFMQAAVPAGTGAMFAIIGLDDGAIAQACNQASEGEVVSPVNFNSPGQVVIAGSKAAAERAAERCKEMGAKRALPLAVSVPSHCALMQPAAEQLKVSLNEITLATPAVDVINNVDVSIETDQQAIKDALVRQLYSPVRWTETVQAMAAKGITQLIEVGPGKVLTGLTKRIDKSLTAEAVNTPDSLEKIQHKD